MMSVMQIFAAINDTVDKIDLPEKFNATLFMFMTKAAPTVPWPMSCRCSPVEVCFFVVVHSICELTIDKFRKY